MKTIYKNHFVIIDPDGDIIWNSVSEHKVVTETVLQVQTEWPLEKAKQKGYIIANIDIHLKKSTSKNKK